MEFQGASFQNLGSWLLRLARLDLTVFDDVKDDVSATVPTLTVAVVASFLSGLGSWLWWTFQDFPKGGGDVFIKSFLMGSILQVGVWFLWVYVAAMVLSKGLGVTADLNRMIRTMGLAFAPMGIAVLMLISFLTVPFGVIASSGHRGSDLRRHPGRNRCAAATGHAGQHRRLSRLRRRVGHLGQYQRGLQHGRPGAGPLLLQP